jgi:hypothetical protein
MVEAGRHRPAPGWNVVPAAKRSVPALDGRGTMADFSRPAHVQPLDARSKKDHLEHHSGATVRC